MPISLISWFFWDYDFSAYCSCYLWELSIELLINIIKIALKINFGFFKVFWVEGLGSRLSRPWLEKSWRVEGYQGLDLKKVEEFKAFKALTWKKLKANFKALSWSNPRFKAIVPRNLNLKVKIANSSMDQVQKCALHFIRALDHSIVQLWS